MVDPNNQNYFSLEEEVVAPLPWWKVRRYQMQILAIAGVFLGVSIVGYYAFQAYSLTHVDADALNTAKTMINNAETTCATAADPSACEATARKNAARATGVVSVCDGLSSAEYANCVSLIAQDKTDASLCSVLSGSEKVACEDGATLAAARRLQEYRLCETIVSPTLKSGCQGQLLEQVILDGECEAYGISADVCDFPGKLQNIIAKGDPTACAQLLEDQRFDCEDAFSSIDADLDGLSLLEEWKLGTSDNAADTDQDGYTDLEEFQSGHDPLH